MVTHERYKENNPLNETDTAIIVTSYSGHLPFLKYALSRYKETGKYVILSYDRHGETLPEDILDIPDSVVFKHKTWGSEKRIGWLFDIIYGSSILNLYNIKNIVTVNGDCIWDKPQNIGQLIDMLDEGYSLISASSDVNLIHTCNVIWDGEVFSEFVYYIIDKLEKNIPESYSPEVLLRDFCNQGMVTKHLPEQPRYPKGHFYEGRIDHYSAYNQDSTWKNVLGYRNLGGEHKAYCLEHLEPVPKKYFDLRGKGKFLNKHEQDTLYHYFMTNDRRWLYKYWSEGEDSYWNRRYYPLEYYGDVPLNDDSRRKELGPPSERLGHFDRWKYNSFVLKDDEYHSKWKKVIEGG